MNDWRFSWRAIGAWLFAALGASLFFGVALSGLNLWVDPEQASEFWSTLAIVAAVAAVGLLFGGGILLLVAVFAARSISWPRPILECSVLTVACFAICNSDGLVEFSLETADGVVAPMAHPAAFLAQYIAPALTGAMMGWLYWRIVAPKRLPHVA
ncbi:MAG: hypothetical protein R3C27_04360 [Hyphomonadaceae bacterium]